MNRPESLALVLEVIADYFESVGLTYTIDPETVLVGPGGVLDSIGLVTVVLDLEAALRERGLDVSLSADQALSAKSSPFRTPSSFADFVQSESARGV